MLNFFHETRYNRKVALILKIIKHFSIKINAKNYNNDQFLLKNIYNFHKR